MNVQSTARKSIRSIVTTCTSIFELSNRFYPILSSGLLIDIDLIRSTTGRILKIYSIGQSVRVQVASIHQVLLRRQSCSINKLERLIFILEITALPASLSPSISYLVTCHGLDHFSSQLESVRSRTASESGRQLQVEHNQTHPSTNHHTQHTHNNSPWSP